MYMMLAVFAGLFLLAGLAAVAYGAWLHLMALRAWLANKEVE